MSPDHSSEASGRSPVAPGLRPTRVRWRLVGMLTLITASIYFDRLNLGIAGHFIQSEFALSTRTADRASWTRALDFAALVTLVAAAQ